MAADDQHRMIATINGRVQGVGYRYATEQKARHLGLTGWVRNQPDRSVVVVAEGTRQSLDQLRQFLQIGPPGAQVVGMDIRWQEASGEFKSFETRLR